MGWSCRTPWELFIQASLVLDSFIMFKCRQRDLSEEELRWFERTKLLMVRRAVATGALTYGVTFGGAFDFNLDLAIFILPKHRSDVIGISSDLSIFA